jgi:hypothetical protein
MQLKNSTRPEGNLIAFPRQPYAGLDDALIFSFLNRKPHNFDATSIVLNRCAYYVQVPSEKYREAYIREDQVRGMSERAEKAFALLTRLGIVRPKERSWAKAVKIADDAKLPPWDLWQPKKRSRTVDLNSARDDATIFDRMYRNWGDDGRANTPWVVAKDQIGKSLARKTVYQKNDYLRSKSRDYQQRYSRFVHALACADSRLYLTQLPNQQTITIHAESYFFPEREYSETVHNFYLNVISETARNLRTLSPRQYTNRFQQKPPKNAFDELINSHWRKLAATSEPRVATPK